MGSASCANTVIPLWSFIATHSPEVTASAPTEAALYNLFLSLASTHKSPIAIEVGGSFCTNVFALASTIVVKAVTEAAEALAPNSVSLAVI